ncbi:MAG: helix-turn-helix transcriptional regulator [Caldilineaceae bacterium]
MQTFVHWLKQQRKILDLTQADLAGRVGCAVVTIQKIEEGKRRASKQVAALLADHLAIAPQDRDRFLRLARGETVNAPPPTNLPTPLTSWFGSVTNCPDRAAVGPRRCAPVDVGGHAGRRQDAAGDPGRSSAVWGLRRRRLVRGTGRGDR